MEQYMLYSSVVTPPGPWSKAPCSFKLYSLHHDAMLPGHHIPVYLGGVQGNQLSHGR